MLKKIKELLAKKSAQNERWYFLLLFFVALSIYFVGIFRVKSFIWGDSLYYYAYTRSIVMDHNIDFSNEAFHAHLGFPNPPEISAKTGLITNKFSPGTAFLWMPGFIVGQSIALVGQFFFGRFAILHSIFSTDGFGILPQIFVSISAIGMSVSGLWFVYQTLCLWFQRRTVVLSTLAFFLTTPLFYYTAIDPVNSHSASFFLSAILLYQMSQVLQKKQIQWQNVLPMGIVAGFLILVRNQDLVIVIPFLLALLFTKKEAFLDKLNWLVLFGGSVCSILGIQLMFTVHLFGILGSPYLIRGEQLSWFKPDFIRVLFIPENGLFFFAPTLFFATLFLVFQLKKKRLITILSLVIVALQAYVIASWGREIVGGPYGSRMFVSVLPQLSIGLAYALDYLRLKVKARQFKRVYVLLLFLFFANMLIQTGILLYRF